MNRIQILSHLLAIANLVLLGGCLEIKTTTTVNTNGTIQRDLVLKGDSAEVRKVVPIFPVDSTWTVTRTKANDSTWISTTTKHFPDGTALTKALEGVEGKTLQVRAQSGQRFLWFTTEFTYSETLLCYKQFNAIPLSKYVTPEELNFSSTDSLTKSKFEKVAEEWDTRNKFEAYFVLFVKAVEKLGNSALTREQVQARKETLYARSRGDLEFASTRADKLPVVFEEVLNSPLVHQAIAASAEDFANFAEHARFQDEIAKTPYTQANLIMPGVITSSNASSIEGSRLEWKDFLVSAYFTDYAMWARSRVVNWWAVVGTGCFAILLVGLLLVGAWRKSVGATRGGPAPAGRGHI